MYSHQFSVFFLRSRYHDKVVSQRSQRNYKIGGLFSKMPQSNRITLRKSCVAFFRANLPNCPVKQLYTLLNQKMFAGNWRVRVPPFSLFFWPNGYQRRTSVFIPFLRTVLPRHSRSVHFVLGYTGLVR